MAEGTIDNLTITISAQAQSAADSVGKLANSLERMKTAASTGYINVLGGLANALNNLNSINGAPSKLQAIARSMEAIGKASKNITAASAAGTAIYSLVKAVNTIDAATFQRLDALSKGLTRLAEVGKVSVPAGLANNLQTISNAVKNIDPMTGPKLEGLATGLKYISESGKVHLNPSLGTAIEGISNAAANVDQQTGLKLQQIAIGLKSLAGIGAINISGDIGSAIDGIINTASNVDTSTASNIQALADALKPLADISINGELPTQIASLSESLAGLLGLDYSGVSAFADALRQLEGIDLSGLANVDMSGVASTFGGIGANGSSSTKFVEDQMEAKKSTEEVENAAERQAQSVRNAQTATESLGNSAKSASHKFGFLKTTLNGVGSALKYVLSSLKSLVHGIGGKLGAFGDVFKKAFGGQLVSELGKATKGVLTFFNQIKRVAMYRAIRTALKLITSGISDGLKNLYTWSQTADRSFSAAMDRITTASKYVGNSFAAMVSPLIETFAPVIDFIADKIVNLFNLINQVFAKLSGSSSYTAAKKVAAQWQEASNTASGSAHKAANEIKRTLLGFDEINKLNSANNPSGGGGGSGGSGGNSASAMFETRMIEGGVSSFVDQLKSAFASGGWQEVTGLLTDKINNLIASVDWAGLGKKVGEKLNTVIDVLRAWYNGINWTAIGEDIGTALNNLIKTIKWGDLGRLMSEKVGALVSLLKGGLTSIEWPDVGQSLADAINGFFSNDTLWKDLGTSIDTVLQGVLDFTSNFVINFDEKEAAKRIQDALGRIDWPTIASKFWETAKTAFKKVGNFLTVLLGGDFYDVNGDAVDQLWNRFDANGKMSQKYSNGFSTGLANAISTAIKTALNGVANFVETEINWEEIGTQLNNFLTGLDWAGIAGAFWNAITEAAKGLGTVILAALFGKDSTIYKNLTNNGGGGAAVIGGGAVVGGLLLKGDLKNLLKGGASGTSIGTLTVDTLSVAGTLMLASGAISGIQEIIDSYNTMGSENFWKNAGENIVDLLKNPGDWAALMVHNLGNMLGIDSDIAELMNTFNSGIVDPGLPLRVDTQLGQVGPDYLTMFSALTSLKDSFGSDVKSENNLNTEGHGIKFDGQAYNILTESNSNLSNMVQSMKTNTNALTDNTAKLKKFGASTPISNVATKLSTTAGVALAKMLSENTETTVDVDFVPNDTKRYKNDILGYLNNTMAPGTDTIARVGLKKDGWTSLATYIGTNTPLSAAVKLAQSGWTSLATFIGTNTPLSAAVKLAKSGWNLLSGFVGTTTSSGATNPLSVLTQLIRWGWSSLEDFTGDELSVWTQLVRWGWTNISSFVGENVNVYTALRRNGWANIFRYLTGNDNGDVTLKVKLESAKENSTLVISAKRGGGIFSGRGWMNIPQYAGGTANAHGSLFLAGEAGPELVGHVGGRTEVLNKSQLASAMYSAVHNAMNGVTLDANFYNADGDMNGSGMAEMMDYLRADSESMRQQNELLRQQNELLRQINAKDWDVDISTADINRAQTRQNRRAGTTIVAVATT